MRAVVLLLPLLAACDEVASFLPSAICSYEVTVDETTGALDYVLETEGECEEPEFQPTDARWDALQGDDGSASGMPDPLTGSLEEACGSGRSTVVDEVDGLVFPDLAVSPDPVAFDRLPSNAWVQAGYEHVAPGDEPGRSRTERRWIMLFQVDVAGSLVDRDAACADF